MYTPKHKWVVELLALGLLFSQPFVIQVYYQTNFLRGAYPPEADTIAIPIMEFMVGWCITLPFSLAFFWFGLREYPGGVSLFAYNKTRPIWSVIWSLLLLFMAGRYLYLAVQYAIDWFPLNVVYALLNAYLMLCFRSSLMYSTAFKKTIDKTTAITY